MTPVHLPTVTSPHLTVIIVSYNVRELLGHCLDSLFATAALRPELRLEAIAVDNASADGSVELLRKSYPQVQVIANAANLGFSRAVNQALAQAQGEAALVLNPDTELLGDALGTLWEELRAHPEVALVGPMLLNTDGSVQSTRRRFPTLLLGFIESTVLQRPLRRLPPLARYYCLDQPDDLPQEVDWLTGACLLVRRSALDEVGLLDERFFMYFEEVDWCWRLRQAGWRVRYQPAARVLHHGSRSADQDETRRHIHFQTSKWRFYAKHFGPFGGQLLRWFLWATFCYQLLEEAAKLLLGHKPSLRRQRVQSYLRVLRTGLA